MTARVRVHLRRAEPGVWAYEVIQDEGTPQAMVVGCGWSRVWADSLRHGLGTRAVYQRYPLTKTS